MKDSSLVKFILSKEFRTQLKYALAIFFALIFIVNICLWFFTRHSNKLIVPDFKGLTLVESSELADDNDMQIHIMDSVYNQLQAPGSVIEQEPKPGSSVKKNRRIFLIMNAMNPEKIQMPNVVGVSLRQAIAILESNGLVVGRLKYVSDIATNNVLNQRMNGKEIRSGKEINKGSYIDLVLGQSGGESTEIPDLIGLKKREAERKISQSCLNMGNIKYDNTIVTSADSLNAFVKKQKPDIETKYVSMGTSIDIWLTIEKQKPTAKTKDKTKSKKKHDKK
jgi:beta-lactam-binding protein with PASTA domain